MQAVAMHSKGCRDVVMNRQPSVLHTLSWGEAACPACRLHDLCLAEGLDAECTRQLNDLVTARIRLLKGDALFRAGDPFTSL